MPLISAIRKYSEKEKPKSSARRQKRKRSVDALAGLTREDKFFAVMNISLEHPIFKAENIELYGGKVERVDDDFYGYIAEDENYAVVRNDYFGREAIYKIYPPEGVNIIDFLFDVLVKEALGSKASRKEGYYLAGSLALANIKSEDLYGILDDLKENVRGIISVDMNRNINIDFEGFFWNTIIRLSAPSKLVRNRKAVAELISKVQKRFPPLKIRELARARAKKENILHLLSAPKRRYLSGLTHEFYIAYDPKKERLELIAERKKDKKKEKIEFAYLPDQKLAESRVEGKIDVGTIELIKKLKDIEVSIAELSLGGKKKKTICFSGKKGDLRISVCAV